MAENYKIDDLQKISERYADTHSYAAQQVTVSKQFQCTGTFKIIL